MKNQILSHAVESATNLKAHTDGPWIAKSNQVYSENTGETVAVIPGARSDDPIPANARLISAAPELLEACKAALTMMLCVMDSKDSFGQVSCSPKWLKTRDSVREAITKATGGAL